MSIIREFYRTREDGIDLYRTYSDAGKYVVRDGVSYEEAIDPDGFDRVYDEGDLIPEDDPTNEDYQQIGKIMMGVAE